MVWWEHLIAGVAFVLVAVVIFSSAEKNRRNK